MTAHRIGRIEIELRVDDEGLGRRLLPRLSLLYERGIAPLLGRLCGTLSPPGRLDRIDSLELDLGHLPADDLDGALLARLESALRAELGQRLPGADAGAPTGESAPSAQSSPELLEYFARTGQLPWWAERADPGSVARHLLGLLEADPGTWQRLLGTLAEDPVAIARLARHWDPGLWAALLRQDRPGGLLADLRELEGLVAAAGGAGAGSLVRQVRALTLAELGRDGPAPSPRRLPGLVLELLGALDARTLADLAAAPVQTGAGPRLRAAIGLAVATSERAPVAQPPGPDARTAPGPRREAPLRDAGAEAPLPEAQTPGPAVREAGASGGGREAGASRPAGPARVRRADPGPTDAGPGRNDDQGVGEERAQRPPPRTPDRPAPPAPAPDPPADASDHPADRGEEAARIPIRLAVPDRPGPARAAARRALADQDELYVEDAGLVMLWPFLERLFERTDLLAPDRDFRDGPARMQAVSLLALLVFDDPEPPEYLLALAKLLCGLSPEDPCQPPVGTWEPPAPEHIAECERLLAAAIDHAKVLGEMSPDGLRSAYLQRPGALTAPAGTWLLAVEGRPQDALLPLFPWGWGWVRLPWMPGPIQVNWSS